MKIRAEEIKHGWIIHKPSAHTTRAHVVWKISWVSTFRSLITDFSRERDWVHDIILYDLVTCTEDLLAVLVLR